jgi:hypothetical protein
LLGQVALGATLGAIRGATMSYERQMLSTRTFRWNELGADTLLSATEGSLLAFGSLTGGVLSYLHINKLPTKLVPILRTGLDMLLNEGTSGAGVGAARVLVGKEDDLTTAVLHGLGLGLGIGGAFRFLGHSGIAMGRRTIGEFLYRDLSLQYKLIRAFGNIDGRCDLPNATPLRTVKHDLKYGKVPIPLWIQPLDHRKPFGPQNPYFGYRNILKTQTAIGIDIEKTLSALRTAVEERHDGQIQLQQRRLLGLLDRTVEHYARYAYVLSNGGQQSGLLVQHLADEFRQHVRKKNSPMPAVLSVVFSGIAKNNTEIGHIAQDYILQASYRAYAKAFKEKLGWDAHRLSGITEQGRVNLACLLTASEAKTIQRELKHSDFRLKFTDTLNTRILKELEDMIPYAPGRLHKDGDTLMLLTDAAPGRPAQWIHARGALLVPHFGLAQTSKTLSTPRTLAKTETAPWTPVRRRPRISSGPTARD